MPYFVFSDGRETFAVQIVDPAKVQHARGLIDGSIVEATHIGGIVTVTPAEYNVGWSYQLAPDDVTFYDMSAEIADAGIRDVEEFVQSGRPLDEFLPHNFWGSWATFVVRELREIAGTAEIDALTGTRAAEIIFGHGGNDSLWGAEGDDFLLGGDGDDRLDGGLGNDKAGGGEGNDILYGGWGNDVLDGGIGADRMYGGLGNDTFIVDSDLDLTREYADGGTDLVKSSVSHALRPHIEQLKLLGADNIDGRGNDEDNVLIGNSGDNRLWGLDGDDILYGDGGDGRISSGNDHLFGGAGDDRLYGGKGDDRLDGGAGIDRLYGGLGNDVYVVSDTTDYTYENAEEGYDRVYSSISTRLRDNVERLDLTGSANLTGRGNAQDNSIVGNAGANRLIGGAGDDRLYGRDGNDRLEGNAGVDRMYGGVGNDTYVVSDSTDYAYEAAGEGIDAVYASVTHVLRANIERLYLTGSEAISGYGNDLANVLVGNEAGNLIAGRAGNDLIKGAGGDDILYGEDGNDWIEGGSGIDRFYGGAGADRFVFRDGDIGTSAATADQIHDLSQAESDRIHLDALDADTTTGGRQDFAFIGSTAFSGTAGELRFEQISGNTYVQGDTDGDGAADFWIRLDGLHTLESGDFIF